MHNKKPGAFCGRCRAVHEGGCPHNKKAWQNRRGKPGRGGRPHRRSRERIFARDNYLCVLCLGKGKLTSVSLHGFNHGILDHITALAEGGTDDDANKQTICQACNKLKTSGESQRAKRL